MPRPTDWVDTRVILEVSTSAQSITSLVTGLSTANTRSATIIRTIIRLGLFSNSVAGAWGVASLDLAIGIASQEAFVAGVVPDPNSATEKPARGWMWRTQMQVAQNGVGSQVIYSIEADVRSGRKVENGEVYLVANNTPYTGTQFQVNVVGMIRQLYKV